MQKMLIALFVFLTISIVCSGCARNIVLHPLDGRDYKEEKSGEKVDWVCLTPDYFQEIAKARLGK